jgi:ABC-2 type transport system permease protein
MLLQARAIVWAQYRALFNFYSRGHVASLVFTVVMSVLWYGMVAAGAFFVALLLSNPARSELAQRVVPIGLAAALGYWQIVPIILAATGASLDLKKLVVYPVAHSHLFLLEVLLRFTTGLEMTIVLIGATIGLLLNPRIPAWAPIGFLPFIAMNLLLSAGLRDLLGRLLARKRIRELAVFLLVLLMALPQLVIMAGLPEKVKQWVPEVDFNWWPWNVTAHIVLGRPALMDWIVLGAWLTAAYLFGRWQFERGFRFDADAVRAAENKSRKAAGWSEPLFRIPSLLLPDPLGALVEREIRFLSRAPRFRLVFLMGFSFGLIIWLPLAFRFGRAEDSVMGNNYLTFVTVYALMLLGEVTFWNTFGFDRSAVQVYFVTPVKLSMVLLAKNIAAAFYVLLEITAVALVCMLLRMPVTPAKLAESYAVTLVLALYLMAIGNLGSTYYPRPVNPAHSWRTASAGRFQALLLLIYPVVSIPIALAYLARWTFESVWAFYGVLSFGFLLGAVTYWVAMDSAVEAAEERKERLVSALSQGEGPVSA